MRRAEYARAAGLTLVSGSLLALALLCAQRSLWVPCAGFSVACIVVAEAAINAATVDAQRRVEAILAEVHARPRDATEGVVAVELAAACCETWWTSCGFLHESDCRHWRTPAR